VIVWCFAPADRDFARSNLAEGSLSASANRGPRQIGTRVALATSEAVRPYSVDIERPLWVEAGHSAVTPLGTLPIRAVQSQT
jgi:hypothetical protein